MNKVTAPILEIAIKESLMNYESKEDNNFLQDLYLYIDNEDNSLVIYDNTDFELNKVQLPDDQSFDLTHTLQQVFQQAEKEQLFKKDYILKPFTVSLVDKDFVVLEEIFFLDDDTVKINDSMWTNIEKDLDVFIDNLLK